MAKRIPPQSSNGNGRAVTRRSAREEKHAATKSPIELDEALSADVASETSARLPILKTYKLYIGGKFPRSESGRYDTVRDVSGAAIANICRGSKKDFRDSVVAARAAQGGWAKRSAYNRAQILYRIAEMLEGRKAQFVEELSITSGKTSPALEEVQASIDRLVYYAGWADKYTQVFSGVNPVASSHFNFSMHEPTGIVGIFAPDAPALLGLITLVAATIVGGNSAIVLASEATPIPAVTLGEVLATSDLPGGVVNILTGQRAELAEHFASHMDVNATIYGTNGAGGDRELIKKMQTLAAANVKRVIVPKIADYYADRAESPYLILDTQEVKTTWHPVGT